MDPIGLSEAQKAHFETFGFLALPGLLDDRIDEILHDFEALWARCGGGHNGRPHEGVQRSCLAQFIDRDARLSSLLDDPRIAGLATSLLGTDFNYMGSDGNYYTGDTRWHSDGWHRDLLHIKIAFYLDPLGRDSGCLRVIPGTHRKRIDLHDLLPSAHGPEIQTIDDLGHAVFMDRDDAIDVPLKAGDLIIADARLMHGAWPNQTDQRRTLVLAWHRVFDFPAPPSWWRGPVPDAVKNCPPDLEVAHTRTPSAFIS